MTREPQGNPLTIWGPFDEDDCPVRDVLDRVSQKWPLLLMFALMDAPKRFSELNRMIADISKRMLTQSLRELERDGLVSRHVRPTSPPTVTYDLTELGRSALDPLSSLVRWADGSHSRIRAARREYDRAEAMR